jgi:hypothetical protein
MTTTIKFAQFIRICRWLQLVHKDQLAPLENAPFSTLWARKRYRVGPRFHQYLRATNWPAKEPGLLPAPRLRTGRESFPSSSSSISKAV